MAGFEVTWSDSCPPVKPFLLIKIIILFILELKTAEQEEEEQITSKDLEEIESALEEIAEEKNLDIDKEELEDLKEDISDYKEVSDYLSIIIIDVMSSSVRCHTPEFL